MCMWCRLRRRCPTMTMVGEVRVIPQHLDDTYALLLPYFQALCQEAHPA